MEAILSRHHCVNGINCESENSQHVLILPHSQSTMIESCSNRKTDKYKDCRYEDDTAVQPSYFLMEINGNWYRVTPPPPPLIGTSQAGALRDFNKEILTLKNQIWVVTLCHQCVSILYGKKIIGIIFDSPFAFAFPIHQISCLYWILKTAFYVYDLASTGVKHAWKYIRNKVPQRLYFSPMQPNIVLCLGPFSVSCSEFAHTMLSQSQVRLLK